MLDILMPVPVADLKLAVSENDNIYEGAILNVTRDVDVPFKMCVVVDGGTREDMAALRCFMPTLGLWSLSQNNGVRGIPQTLSAMLSFSRNQFIAVVPPSIWLNDPKWFGKMQVVFTKDPHTMMVAAGEPDTESSTMHPVRLDHKTHPVSPFFLTSLNAARNVLGTGPLQAADYAQEYSRRAKELGGTRWVASSVRYGDFHAGQKARSV